jgi:hypothetical protein
VRSIYADWEHSDFSSAEWADGDIEFVIADGPDPGRWTGLTRMADAFRRPASTLASFRVEADEYRDLDERTLPVLLRAVRGRGRISGLEITRLVIWEQTPSGFARAR